MAQPNIPQKDWPYYKAEYDARRMSQGAIAKALDITQGAVSKRFKRMDKAAVNGNLPAIRATLLKARAHPVHSRAQRRDDLEMWCQTVDADLAAVKAEIDTLKARVSVPHLNGAHPVHSRAHTQPSKSRGIRLPGDLWDMLDAHTQATGLSITEILVPLLDTFFAEMAEEVRDA